MTIKGVQVNLISGKIMEAIDGIAISIFSGLL